MEVQVLALHLHNIKRSLEGKYNEFVHSYYVIICSEFLDDVISRIIEYLWIYRVAD